MHVLHLLKRFLRYGFLVLSGTNIRREVLAPDKDSSGKPLYFLYGKPLMHNNALT